MGSLGTIIVAAVLVVGVLALINKQAVLNFFGAGRAQLGKVGRAAADADPLAMAQQEAEDAAKKIKPLIDAQKKAEATLQLLNTQVADDTKEQARLDYRIKQALAKDPPDQASAERHALEIAQVEARLKTNAEQQASQEENVKHLAQMVDMDQRKMKEIQDKLAAKGQRLQQSAAIAEANAAFVSLTGGDIFGKLNSSLSKVDQKIAENEASAKVDAQQCAGAIADIQEEEEDRAAQAASVLDRYKSKAQAPAA